MTPRRMIWTVLAAWAVLVAAMLPVREVMPPDEGRFIQQAQEMRDSGRWFVPTIGEIPNADKPPMLFWLVNLASFRQTRIGEAAARIPSALGALVVLLLTLRLGRRLWGAPEVGLAGALVLVTMGEFLHRAQWVSCDMPLTAFVWLGLTAWREGLFEPDGRPGGSEAIVRPSPATKVALGWLAASAAVLTKGPVGLLWPLFWVCGEAWARRQWRPLRRLVRPLGLLLFVAPIAGWLALFAAGAGSKKLFEVTLRQTFVRYVSAWNLVKPWHFYLHQLPLDLLPWTVFLPGLLVYAWRRRRDRGSERPDAVAVLCGTAFIALGLLFFSISSGKRNVYLLPALPVFALLFGRVALDLRAPDELGPRWRRVAYLALAAFGLVFAAVIPAVLLAGPPRAVAPILARAGLDWLPAIAAGGAALTAGALVAWWLAARRHDATRALHAAAAGAAVLLFAIGTFGGQAWSRFQGLAAFGAEVARVVPREDRLAVERRKFELFLYYSARRGTEWETEEDLAEAIERDGCRFVLLSRSRWEKLRASGSRAGWSELFADSVGHEEFVLVGIPGAGP
ncbi:MAG: phospholipid carrier-dependent glycosyltransferase [Acidobacteria bacterium]|nr:phospholipid carrier-dependent glycosyltransferase [Acidobacteriota bacterium]